MGQGGVGWRAGFCSLKSHVKLSNLSDLEEELLQVTTGLE